LRILGPVEVEGDDGQVVTPVRRRERGLLGILLLEPGQVVPAHRLAELLWDGDPPDRARRALYSHVARIRALPADAGAGADEVALVSHGDGYLIRVAPELVDAQRFRRLVEQAGRTADLTGRARLLREALALWRGPVLHNAVTDRLGEQLGMELAELRLHATEESMAVGLAQGAHAELVGELARLAAAHPLRSRLLRLHLLALYHCGRTGDALEAYAAARSRLAEELGIDPDDESRRLHDAILRGEPVPRSDLPAPDPTATRPAQLPPDLAAFTGRDFALKLLDELASVPGSVVAIVGTAGVGKTTLAVHWAHRSVDRFPDGQLYVNLRGFDPGSAMAPEEAVPAFLDALGVAPHRVPSSLAAQVGLYRSLIAGKRLLVLLDNAASPEQVRPLLPGTPGCLALVTSRSQLAGLVATAGARPVPLDLLSADESRELLARRLGLERVAVEPAAAATAGSASRSGATAKRFRSVTRRTPPAPSCNSRVKSGRLSSVGRRMASSTCSPASIQTRSG
jgi:DNA-binding SARP family transcriptional activator